MDSRTVFVLLWTLQLWTQERCLCYYGRCCRPPPLESN